MLGCVRQGLQAADEGNGGGRGCEEASAGHGEGDGGAYDACRAKQSKIESVKRAEGGMG